MKIIHCADLHLDLIIAGDLFDTAKSFQRTVKKQVLHLILSHPEITFLYLKGNHDSESFFEEQEKLPENLKFFSSDRWISYDFGKLCITGRELPSSVPESVYNELVLDSSRINIVVLHGEIVKSTGKADAPFINLSKLKNKFIDYIALGHIHSYSCERLDKRGVYCYSGCLEGRGFDETGSKGYVLIDVNEENNSDTIMITQKLDGKMFIKNKKEKKIEKKIEKTFSEIKRA